MFLKRAPRIPPRPRSFRQVVRGILAWGFLASSFTVADIYVYERRLVNG